MFTLNLVPIAFNAFDLRAFYLCMFIIDFLDMMCFKLSQFWRE